MSFSNEVVLKDVSEYSKEKIDIGEISISNYVSTENLLPDIGGKALSSGLPSKGKATKYCKGDILISNIRPYFKKIWQADNEGGSSNDVLVLKAKRNIEGKFLYYNLACSAFFDYVMSGAKGTKMPRGDKNHILGYKLNLPPMQEQKAIAHILSTLDDKIEVNNQINKTLENMAQAIFKQWFVDFEFPNEDGEPYKSSGGEMFESELGMIPKGWEVLSLADIADIQKGLSYKGKHLVDDGVPMVNLGNINPGGGFRDDKIKYYNGDFKERHRVAAGDIVFANTDMTQDRIILGSPCFVPRFKSETIIFTHHLFAFRDIKIPKSFLYYFLKSDSFRERAESYATGTTVLALPKEGVISIRLSVATENLMKMFDDTVSRIIKEIEVLNYENHKLIAIRDTLLPKLMSGEIRVPFDEEGEVS